MSSNASLLFLGILMVFSVGNSKLLPVSQLNSHLETIVPGVVTFIGPSSTGKSSIIGQLLAFRMDSNKKEEAIKKAKDAGKPNLAFSSIVDTTDAEVEAGRTLTSKYVPFPSFNKRLTLLDTPSEVEYDQQMTKAVGIADAVVIVVSAIADEFDAQGGWLIDYINLCIGLNKKNFVFAINKIDAVEDQENRYNTVVEALREVVDQAGLDYEEYSFIPVSGYNNHNLLTVATETYPWYQGVALMTKVNELLPQISISTDSTSRLSFPIYNAEEVKNKGTIAYGKLEQNILKTFSDVKLCPSGISTKITQITDIHGQKRDVISSSEFVGVALRGVSIDELPYGTYLTTDQKCIETTAVRATIHWKNLDFMQIGSFDATTQFGGFSTSMKVAGDCEGYSCGNVKSASVFKNRQSSNVRFESNNDKLPFSDRLASGKFFALRENSKTIGIGTVEDLLN